MGKNVITKLKWVTLHVNSYQLTTTFAILFPMVILNIMSVFILPV